MSRYEVDGVLGKGASGVVYRARQVGVASRLVAYKRVPAGDQERLGQLRSEAQILAALDHPNVIRIYDVVDDGDAIAIVMQYAAGGSLADRLARGGPLPAGEVAAILIGIAGALQSAHARNVLHGDIKPSNILFTADGHPLLSDFGAATLGTAPASGTPEYLDAFVTAGGAYDERSDVYSLAVVAFEMLAGRRPSEFDQRGDPEAADPGTTNVATTLLTLAPATPIKLAAVIAAALHPDPAQRPANAEAFLAALRTAVRGVPSVAAAPRPAPDAPVALRRTEPPTRPFGRRPPAPSAPPEESPEIPWRRVAIVAAALVILPSLAVALLRGPAAPSATAAVVVARPAPAPEKPAPICPRAQRPSTKRNWTVLAGALDGTGCRSWVRYRDGLLEIPVPDGAPRRWHVGAAGDQVVLGDWDCNGTATAALYQATTGIVFIFDRWPANGAALRSSSSFDTGIRGGATRVVDGTSCEKVEVVAPLGA